MEEREEERRGEGETRERAVFCRFPKACGSASGRRAAAAPGDSEAPGTAPSPAPGLVSASRARSPPLALPLSPSPPGSQPGRALPRPLPLPSPPPPPPASRKRVAPRRATRWGRLCWGRGRPGGGVAIYVTAAAGAGEALWASACSLDS